MNVYLVTAEEIWNAKYFGYVLLRGNPCTIVHVSKNKQGKIVIVGIDVLTKQKYYLTVRADTIMTKFVLTQREFRLLSIDNDVFHFESTGNNNIKSIIVNEWKPYQIDSKTKLMIYVDSHNKLHKEIETMFLDNMDAIIFVNIRFAPKRKNKSLDFYPVISFVNKM